MAEILSTYDIHFDEVDKLCVLEPEVLKQTHSLKDESKAYIEKIDEFQKIVDTFIGVMERLGKEVEKQKMEAIGAHNVLQSMEKDILTSQQQLQALISEKSMELERLKIQHMSLQKTEMEQNEIIARLTHL